MLTLMLHDTKHNSFRAHPNLWQALAGIFWQWNSNKIVVLFIFVIPVFTLIKFMLNLLHQLTVIWALLCMGTVLTWSKNVLMAPGQESNEFWYNHYLIFLCDHQLMYIKWKVCKEACHTVIMRVCLCKYNVGVNAWRGKL